MPRALSEAAMLIVAAISLATAPGSAWATEAGNAERGREIAWRNCANCHVLTPGQTIAPALQPQGPPFVAIAANPENTADRLRRFLATTHQDIGAHGMPNPILSDEQRADVVAFILSQRRTP